MLKAKVAETVAKQERPQCLQWAFWRQDIKSFAQKAPALTVHSAPHCLSLSPASLSELNADLSEATIDSHLALGGSLLTQRLFLPLLKKEDFLGAGMRAETPQK